MMFLHLFSSVVTVQLFVHMCSKISLFLQTGCVQLKVSFGRKVDMNSLVEVFWMLTGMKNRPSWVTVNSMPDFFHFCVLSSSVSITRVPWAINLPRRKYLC